MTRCGFLYVPSWISLCPFVDFFMSLHGFLYVLSWISLCPIALTIRVFTGLFSVCNQVGNQESNQESNQVYQSRNNATYGR